MSAGRFDDPERTRGTLVVGYGSIGARHVRLLSELGCRTAVVSRRAIAGFPVYTDLARALDAERPDYVVVANETVLHLDTLDALAGHGYTGTVLVEKPLSHRAGPLPPYPFSKVFVGYNLRFHPVAQALARALADQTVLSVQAYVGQYLPDWRPGIDYRQSYSAHQAAGGGVLRDLSHEIDLMTWLFGAWRRLGALGGRLGPLEIDSDDCWGLLIALDRCPIATVHLNYLHRPVRRQLVVDTARHSFVADLIAGTLVRDGEVRRFEVGRDDTYRAQHRAVLDGAADDLCPLAQGFAAVEMIAAVEIAARNGNWVQRPGLEPDAGTAGRLTPRS